MTKNVFKSIGVIGLGYIGLPTAAMLASRKIKVVGVDVNQNTVNTINRGEVHIVEPDLDIAVKAAVNEGYLRATSTPEKADAFIIAVPTPFRGDDHEPDLSFIEAASKAIAPHLQPGNLVVLESTSPVGATETMVNWLAEARPDLAFPNHSSKNADIFVAYCPERVMPGKIMQELITNDRVIGGFTSACSERAVELYKTFVTGECMLASGPRVAEMTKLTENSYRDINIALANELSLICDQLEMDVWELIKLANRHPRVDILKPGPGVGGHCIAVDPWFIVSSAPQNARLIHTARLVNDNKPKWVTQQILSRIEALACKRPEKSQNKISVAVYGLTFKPDIDDLRESPAFKVFSDLSNMHEGPIIAVEPNIQCLPIEFQNVQLESAESGIEADLQVVLVNHSVFSSINFRDKEVLDYAGLLNQHDE